MSEKLEKARLKVAETDEQIVPLLVKRLAAVEEIGRIKQREGLGVKDVGRERKVLDRVGELAGEENAEYVQEIYREVMNQACRFQERQKGEGK
ncbi:maltose O-acetyltransferase [Ligilactobacillus ruminis CAG:367]|nr:maltose O-acetyltransferase [Ligilactobacillus ruminis CAG:367]